MHFCVSATRGGFHDGFCCPRKIGTNWFMPALVKRRLGASGNSDDDGTIVCFFSRKKSRNDCRIWAEVMTPKLNATFHRMRELLRFQSNQTPRQKISMRRTHRLGKCGSEFAQIVFANFRNRRVVHSCHSPM